MGSRAHDFPHHFECILAQEKTRGCLKLSNSLTKVKRIDATSQTNDSIVFVKHATFTIHFSIDNTVFMLLSQKFRRSDRFHLR